MEDSDLTRMTTPGEEEQTGARMDDDRCRPPCVARGRRVEVVAGVVDAKVEVETREGRWMAAGDANRS